MKLFCAAAVLMHVDVSSHRVILRPWKRILALGCRRKAVRGRTFSLRALATMRYIVLIVAVCHSSTSCTDAASGMPACRIQPPPPHPRLSIDVCSTAAAPCCTTVRSVAVALEGIPQCARLRQHAHQHHPRQSRSQRTWLRMERHCIISHARHGCRQTVGELQPIRASPGFPC